MEKKVGKRNRIHFEVREPFTDKGGLKFGLDKDNKHP